MTTSYRPVVRSQSDLEAVWKHLMGAQTSDRGFGGHSLWLVVIDADDRPFPQITEITEAVEPPDDEMVSSIATFLTAWRTTVGDSRSCVRGQVTAG